MAGSDRYGDNLRWPGTVHDLGREVCYQGGPLEGCILQKSGNDSFDREIVNVFLPLTLVRRTVVVQQLFAGTSLAGPLAGIVLDYVEAWLDHRTLSAQSVKEERAVVSRWG